MEEVNEIIAKIEQGRYMSGHDMGKELGIGAFLK